MRGAAIKVPGMWTVRVPSTGGVPADGMRMVTELTIYPEGPWASFKSGGVEYFVSRPMIVTRYRDNRSARTGPGGTTGGTS